MRFTVILNMRNPKGGRSKDIEICSTDNEVNADYMVQKTEYFYGLMPDFIKCYIRRD